ncbi:MAG: ATP-binding protein [Anaerolineae bacterium]
MNLFTARMEQATPQELQRLQSYIPSHLVQKIAEEARVGRGERRNVTVLFADLSGFTALSEKLDPEEVYRLLDGCFRPFVEAIYRYEGTVDKFTGDGLMALFGAPLAHEDDPERALRVALEMHQALEPQSKALPASLGSTLALRIGINRGEVVVGGLGSDLRLDYTAVGDTVNVAARLQQMARPGDTLVARAVAEATRALFEFETLGPVPVRGREEPVEAFRLVGLRARPERRRGIPGLSAPMIGRGDEFGHLLEAVRSLSTEGKGHLLLVTGEAGIGKSRLTGEVIRQLDPTRLTVAQGACLSYTQTISYGLLRQVFRSLFRLRDDVPEHDECERISEQVRNLAGDQAEDLLPYLLHLMAVDLREKALAEKVVHLEPARLRQQTFLAVRDFLGLAARQRPLLVILEDLHWVDRSSLDLLLFLAGLTRRVPLILYGISRPQSEAADRIRQWAVESKTPRFLEVRLDRLSPDEAETLVSHLLQTPQIPARVREEISQRAEGNPFFIEEIVRMLIDRGLIRQEAGGWAWAGDPDRQVEGVPVTLQALISARVDALEPVPRGVLEYAAVAGRSFSPQLLQMALPREIQPAIPEALGQLEQRGLVMKAGEKGEQFLFRHGLIRDTVYGSLLKVTRQEVHRRIGQAVEALYAHRLEEQVEVLAYHFSEGRVAAKAVPYLLQAGERAAARFANEEAIRFYEQALQFLDELGNGAGDRVRAYLGLGDVRGFVGQYEAAIQEYLSALDLEERGTRPAASRKVAEIERRVARVYQRQGDQEESLRWLQKALRELDLDPQAAMAVERARVYNDLGWLHFRQGEMQKALAWTTRCLSILEGTHHYQELGAAYNRLVGIYFRLGDLEQARDYAERGLRLRQRMGDTYGLALSYTNLGGLAMFTGEWEQAIEYNRRSLELKERLGDVPGQRSSHSNLGLIFLLKGDFEQAERCLRQALELAEEIQETWGMSQTLANLARLNIARGQWTQALEHLAKGLRLTQEGAATQQLAELAWLQAEAHLGLGDVFAAVERASEAVAAAERSADGSDQGVAYRVLGAALMAAGNLGQADEALARSLELLTEARNRYELGRTYAELGRLRRLQGRLEEARDNGEKALAIFRRLGATHDEEWVSRELQALQSMTAGGCEASA